MCACVHRPVEEPKPAPGTMLAMTTPLPTEAISDSASPSTTHTLTMAKVQAWLASSAKSPSDKIMKERLKGLLAS